MIGIMILELAEIRVSKDQSLSDPRRLFGNEIGTAVVEAQGRVVILSETM